MGSSHVVAAVSTVVEYQDRMGWWVLGAVIFAVGAVILICNLMGQSKAAWWIGGAILALGIVWCHVNFTAMAPNGGNLLDGLEELGVQWVGGEGKNARYFNGFLNGEPVQCFYPKIDDEHVRLTCG